MTLGEHDLDHGLSSPSHKLFLLRKSESMKKYNFAPAHKKSPQKYSTSNILRIKTKAREKLYTIVYGLNWKSYKILRVVSILGKLIDYYHAWFPSKVQNHPYIFTKFTKTRQKQNTGVSNSM